MDTVKRLRELLHERGISLYKLSELGDIPYSTISMAEKRGSQLSVELIERICKALDIELSEFFATEGKEKPGCGEDESLTPEEIRMLKQFLNERKMETK